MAYCIDNHYLLINIDKSGITKNIYKKEDILKKEKH